MIRLTVVIILISSIGFIYAGGYDKSLLPGFIIILCIPVLPTLYLLIEYFLVTRNQLVEITEEAIKITHKRHKAFHYFFHEIEILKIYKSAGMEKGSFPFQTAEMYYHVEVITKDGNKLILTSILGPDFDTAIGMFKNVNKEVIRTIYSTIYI